MSKSYIRARNRKFLLSQYRKVREKAGGQTTGAIYRALDEKGALDKADPDEYLIKESSPTTVIQNFIASSIYKKLMGFQGSEDEIVIGENHDLMIKSKMFPGYSGVNVGTLSEGAGKGFERVVAAKTFLGDSDLKNITNLGLIPSLEGEYFVGIDHECVSFARLDDLLASYQRSLQIFESTRSLRTNNFAEACEEIGSFSQQHLDYHIQYIVDYLRVVFEQLPEEKSRELITRCIKYLYFVSEPNVNSELLKYLSGNSQSHRSMPVEDKSLLKTCLSGAKDIETALEAMEKVRYEFTIPYQDVLLSLYQAALEIRMRKGLAQMVELADLIRLDVAMRTDNFAVFGKIVVEHPDLLINDKRSSDTREYSNATVLRHLFETLARLDAEKKLRFVALLPKQVKESPAFTECVNWWNETHGKNHQIVIPAQADPENKDNTHSNKSPRV